jgi:hypothetical protein
MEIDEPHEDNRGLILQWIDDKKKEPPEKKNV